MWKGTFREKVCFKLVEFRKTTVFLRWNMTHVWQFEGSEGRGWNTQRGCSF